MLGGLQTTSEATEEIKSYCDQLKSQVEEKAGTKFDVYECKTYRQQIVAGTNFFVKVCVGNGSYIHIRIFRKLDESLELIAIKLDMKEDDELQYFQ